MSGPPALKEIRGFYGVHRRRPHSYPHIVTRMLANEDGIRPRAPALAGSFRGMMPPTICGRRGSRGRGFSRRSSGSSWSWTPVVRLAVGPMVAVGDEPRDPLRTPCTRTTSTPPILPSWDGLLSGQRCRLVCGFVQSLPGQRPLLGAEFRAGTGWRRRAMPAADRTGIGCRSAGPVRNRDRRRVGIRRWRRPATQARGRLLQSGQQPAVARFAPTGAVRPLTLFSWPR